MAAGEGSGFVHAEQRHQEILRRLRESGSVRVSDVAGELGVSPITVRRDVEALAGRGLLERVHGGAVLPSVPATGEGRGGREHGGWQPGGRELVVGLIVPAADYYFPEVIKGAREAAAERGIRLVLGISQYDPEQERVQVRHLLADGIDGLLITPCEGLGGLAVEAGVPCVLVERQPGDDAVDAEQVVSDHAYGARIAVRHLAGSGRERIGLLVRDDSPHREVVREGFAGGLAAVGLPGGESNVFPLPSPGRGDERERVLGEFTEAVTSGRLDAALVHNDRDAIVVLQRLRAGGVRVPDDVALVAYDDEVAALADIPLSAVAPQKHAVGVAAVDLIARRLAEPGRARHRVTILPELRVRGSSG